MRRIGFFLLLLGLALPANQALTQVSREAARTLAADSKPVYELTEELVKSMTELGAGSAAFDEFAVGVLTFDEALGRARGAMQGAAGRIDALEARVGQVSLTPTGDAEADALLGEVMSYVRDLPALLRQVLSVVERQVAAAEAGDLEAVARISGELSALAVAHIDRETAMLKLQLVAIDRRHPQHGLTVAWIATNEGLRNLAVLSANAESPDVASLIAPMPREMQEAAGKMLSAITRSRGAIAEIRARQGEPNWIAEILGLSSAADRQFVFDTLAEYEQALAVEEHIAHLIDLGATLVARLAEGNAGDEVTAGLVAFDRRYTRLVKERYAEAEDRLRVLQAWGGQ